MKTRIVGSRIVGSIGAAALVVMLAPSLARAASLYSNGAFNGTKDAWLATGGYTVSDSFTLSQAATVSSINFGLWDYTSEGTVSTASWSITSGINGGTTFGGSPTAALTGTPAGTNAVGYKLTSESFSTGSLVLGPGTYWLNLYLISPSGSVDLFWDEGDGPSQAYETDSNVGNGAPSNFITPANFPATGYPSVVGGCMSPGSSGDCSESFSINGTVSGGISTATPEPSEFGMLAAGLLALAGWLRRRA